MAWDLPGLITLATDRTAAYFNKFKSSFDVLDQHPHDGTDGGGAVLSDLHQRRDYFFVMPYAPATGVFNVVRQINDTFGHITKVATASGVAGDEGTWELFLEQGTYTWHVFHAKDTSHGIASIYVNEVLLGTFDGYGSSLTNFNDAAFTLSLTSSGLQTIRIAMESKNTSSSSYKLVLQGWLFIKQ